VGGVGTTVSSRTGLARLAWLVCAVATVATVLPGCGSGKPSSGSVRSASAPAAVVTARGVRLVRVGVFHAPTYVTGAPGDTRRLFVVEKAGVIVVLVGGHVRPVPFLDISHLVNSSGGEQGLLSMAFAPDYARSGRFYVYYTDSANNLRIVEYRRLAHSHDRADPASARNVLRIDHHSETNHNGGQLQFGPDGELYVGVGDGGSEGDPLNHGQNTDVLLGKLLRISPGSGGGYSIPTGNPFVGLRGKRPEIWAYGLRNPWRFSFDRLTGDLVIGDVGQDRVEEIDFAMRRRGAGANYGWSIFEGDNRYKPGNAPGAVRPALTALHSDGYCAIIGGYVVRDRSLPGLYGRYLYGDDCRPQIMSVKLSSGHASGDHATGLSVGTLAAFGQDTRGRVYAVSLAGPVYRFASR
jgi:glucose/arabinose dehydrogenase